MCGLALGLGGWVALIVLVPAVAASSGYSATRPVPGVAHTSVTVTTSRTASTVTITSSNARILADVVGTRVQVQCSANSQISAAGMTKWAGVTVDDRSFAVWRKGSSSLSLTLPAPLLSGKTMCGTTVNPDHGSGISLQAAFQIAAPTPVAVERSATATLDPATTFRLNGSRLTVTSTNPAFLKIVQGHAVFGTCHSGVVNYATWNRGAGPYRGRELEVAGPRGEWAAGAKDATITLPADISEDVDACYFGAAYGERPTVRASFDAAGAKVIANEHVVELAQIHWALEKDYRFANAVRAGKSHWPSESALVKASNHRPGALLTYGAANTSDVTVASNPYVVRAGTHGSSLELAVLDSYGVTHTLTVTVGGQPRISTDPSGRV